MFFEIQTKLLDIIETEYKDDDGKSQTSRKLQVLVNDEGKYSVWELKTDQSHNFQELQTGENYSMKIELKNSPKYGLSLKFKSII